MSINEEKEWLRAILEGKIKPGDAEWKEIWSGKDFGGVREVLRRVGMRDEKGRLPRCKRIGQPSLILSTKKTKTYSSEIGV